MKTKDDISMSDYVDIDNVDDATWGYLKALRVHDLREKLFPYTRAHMVGLKRARVRTIEDEVFADSDGALKSESPTANLLTNRLLLVTETFSLPDGSRVAWLEATVAQHNERAAMQRRLAGTCLVDAERHDQAAKLITESNVTCLAEIES